MCAAIRDNNPNLCRDRSSDFFKKCAVTCSIYETAIEDKYNHDLYPTESGGKSTLETSGEDVKLHSKRVEKI